MRIDNHVHVGVDPLFYRNGWMPYCLDLPRLMGETADRGIDRWVVFPFVSYVALDMSAMRAGRIELAQGDEADVTYRFENRRLLNDLARLEPHQRGNFLPFLIADPGRQPSEQVREWETLGRSHRVHGIKIQATIIQSPITALLKEGSCMLDFAAERNLPLLIHSSIDPADRWSQCEDILRVVESRPAVRFVLAHSCRFHKASLDRVAATPNAWFDCSAHIIHCRCAVNELPAVARPSERFASDFSSPARVLSDLFECYPDKLIWGSDAPFYSYEDERIQLRSSYREEVGVLDALSPEAQDRVSRANTLAWLGEPQP